MYCIAISLMLTDIFLIDPLHIVVSLTLAERYCPLWHITYRRQPHAVNIFCFDLLCIILPSSITSIYFVYFRSLHINVRLMLANIAQFCLLHIIVSLTLRYIVRFNSLRIIISLL